MGEAAPKDPYRYVSKATQKIWDLARAVYTGSRQNYSTLWIGRGYSPDSKAHRTGRALDIIASRTVGKLPTPTEKAAAEVVVKWLQTNARTVHLRNIIWDKRWWKYRNGSGQWVNLTNRRGISDWHQDHIHVDLQDTNGYIPAFGNITAGGSMGINVNQEGLTREQVKIVQEDMNRIRGLNLTVDGVYGPRTKEAVRGFQMYETRYKAKYNRRLAVDGLVGEETKKALRLYNSKI